MARATSTTTTSRTPFPARTTFPTQMGRQQFYDPPERGFEREIRKRLDYWDRLREAARRLRAASAC